MEMYYGQYCRLRVTVWATNREVIKATSRMIKKTHRYDRASRVPRHVFYRSALELHKDAQKLMGYAMRDFQNDEHSDPNR
jgi:hypothetical protein